MLRILKSNKEFSKFLYDLLMLGYQVAYTEFCGPGKYKASINNGVATVNKQ